MHFVFLFFAKHTRLKTDLDFVNKKNSKKQRFFSFRNKINRNSQQKYFLIKFVKVANFRIMILEIILDGLAKQIEVIYNPKGNHFEFFSSLRKFRFLTQKFDQKSRFEFRAFVKNSS